MFIIYQSGNQKQKLEEAQTTQKGQKKKDKNTNNDPQNDIQKTTP
jgi:hypothetical protein